MNSPNNLRNVFEFKTSDLQINRNMIKTDENLQHS